MKKQLSVLDFLQKYEGREQFSNYDGQYGNFNSDDLTASNAAGGMVAAGLPVAKPYTLRIRNTDTVNIVNAYIFGYNDLSDLPNFGNSVAIILTPANGVSYRKFIAQSQNMPFDISLIRFNCANTVQLDADILVQVSDMNGRSASDPIPLATYKDSYQQQDTIIDVKYPIKIDGNTTLVIPMEPATTLSMTMFAQTIANVSNQLVGGQTAKGFTTPQLSGKNVPIIQVSGANLDSVQNRLGRTA